MPEKEEQDTRPPPRSAEHVFAQDLERRLKLDDGQGPESLQRAMQGIYAALDEIADRIQLLDVSAALEYRVVARAALKYLEAHPDKDAAEDLRSCVSLHRGAIVQANQLKIRPPRPDQRPLTDEELAIVRTVEPILADTLEEVTKRIEPIVSRGS